MIHLDTRLIRRCHSLLYTKELDTHYVSKIDGTNGESRRPRHYLQGTTTTFPPSHSACPPLSEPSISLSVVPLGLILIVDSGIMLAIMVEFLPTYISLALRIVPPGGTSRGSPLTETKSRIH